MPIDLQHQFAEQYPFPDLLFRTFQDDDDATRLADVLNLPRQKLQHRLGVGRVAGTYYLAHVGEDAFALALAWRDAEAAIEIVRIGAQGLVGESDAPVDVALRVPRPEVEGRFVCRLIVHGPSVNNFARDSALQ